MNSTIRDRHVGGNDDPSRAKTKVLMVQGGGEGAHAVDAALAASLQQALGSGYEVRFPRMPDEEGPKVESWKQPRSRAQRSWKPPDGPSPRSGCPLRHVAPGPAAHAFARGFIRKLMPMRLMAFMAAIVRVRSTRSFSPNTSSAAA